MGYREIPFSHEIYIEQEDFMEEPPKNYFRLVPGKEVRLKHAYIIKCEEVIKDEKTGEVIELRCTYDPMTKSGSDISGKKVKGTIHWVSAAQAIKAEVRLYDNLFLKENPEEDGEDFIANLNPNSLESITTSLIEPSVSGAVSGNRYQFFRHGYFSIDPDSTDKMLVFNRVVSLKDGWAKIQKAQNKG
jgi:glutaminyl-tRNA synthetase